MRRTRFLPLAAFLVLIACDEPALPTQSETSVQQTATVPNVALALQPIDYAEFSTLIEPGLGCSFQAEADELLLVATAMDEREDVAEAVVKTDAEAFVIKATQPGGYNALRENGATFTNGVDLSCLLYTSDAADE